MAKATGPAGRRDGGGALPHLSGGALGAGDDRNRAAGGKFGNDFEDVLVVEPLHGGKVVDVLHIIVIKGVGGQTTCPVATLYVYYIKITLQLMTCPHLILLFSRRRQHGGTGRSKRGSLPGPTSAALHILVIAYTPRRVMTKTEAGGV